MDEIQKYYELYLFGKEKLREEKERYDRVDDKINRLLNIITLLIGICGFFGQWVLQDIFPLLGFIEWAIFVLLVLLFLVLLYSWYVILYADRLHDLSFPPLNEETRDFFKQNNSIDIYYHLSKNYMEAVDYNRTKTDNKIWYLKLSHNLLKVNFLLLAIMLILYIIFNWN
ncbi:MAG: hypothetical protein JXR20_03165 [Balneola sp.]